MKYIEAINASLDFVLKTEPKSILLGEDILDPYGGAFRATKGLSTKYPSRIITTPICEASIVGISVGLALRGYLAIAEIMFGDFITLAMDQIVNHASKFRAMYNGQVHVGMIVRTPMGGGRGYGPTHSQSLEKILLGIPYIDVVAPSLFHDILSLYLNGIARKRPIFIIENKILYPEELFLCSGGGLFMAIVKDELGYHNILVKNYRVGIPDVSIVTYGGVSRNLLNVMKNLADEEIRISAIFVGCISPLSQATKKSINDEASISGNLLIIEDGSIQFGWTAEVSANIEHKNVKVRRLGAMHGIIPAAKELERQVLVSENKIQEQVLEMVAS